MTHLEASAAFNEAVKQATEAIATALKHGAYGISEIAFGDRTSE